MSSGDHFPPGWIEAALSDVAEVNPPNPAELPANDTPVSFVPMAFVEALSGRLDPSDVRPWSQVRKGYTRFQDGDVLFAKITPCMENGKAAVARGLAHGVGAGSTEFHVLRPTDALRAELLLHYVLQEEFRKLARAQMTGTAGQLRVPSRFLDDHTIPLPPLPEQHRIVAALESYFTRLDDAVATLERVQRNLKRYRASVLKAAVEGRLVPTEAELARGEGRSYEPASVLLTRILAERRRRWEEAELAKMTAKGKAPKDGKWKAKYVEPVAPDTSELPELPEGWCWATADAVCSDVVSGSTPAASELFLGAGEIPFIKVYNLTMKGELDFTVKPTFIAKATHEQQLARSRVRPGDVLTNIVGPPLGKVAVVPRGYDEWNINQAITAFRPSGGISTEWVRLLLLSEPIQRWLLGTSKTTTSQVNVAVTACRRLPVPLPPVREQARIAAEAERLLSIEAKEGADARRGILRVRRLRQSILKWAFEGRLVDQDPTDEPASVLLERIRAERASASDTPPLHARRAKARTAKS